VVIQRGSTIFWIIVGEFWETVSVSKNAFKKHCLKRRILSSRFTLVYCKNKKTIRNSRYQDGRKSPDVQLLHGQLMLLTFSTVVQLVFAQLFLGCESAKAIFEVNVLLLPPVSFLDAGVVDHFLRKAERSVASDQSLLMTLVRNVCRKSEHRIIASSNSYMESLPKNQARNQLGTPGGAKFSERGPNFLN